jgi:hypothetical protein
MCHVSGVLQRAVAQRRARGARSGAGCVARQRELGAVTE